MEFVYVVQLHPACREALSSGYGKTGDSVHGTVCILQRYRPEVEQQLRALCKDGHKAAVEAELRDAEVIGFHKKVIILCAKEDHQQDACAALGMLEQSLLILKEDFPWAIYVHLQADNASTYHSTLFVIGAWYVALASCYMLLRLWYNTPGHGKDQVDHSFGALKGTGNRWILAGANIPSGVHLAAICAMGARPSTALLPCCWSQCTPC